MLQEQSHDGQLERPRRRHRGLARTWPARRSRGPTHFSQFDPLGRRAVGPGLVRARLHQQPLPHDGRRGRGGPGVGDDGPRRTGRRSRPTSATARRCSRAASRSARTTRRPRSRPAAPPRATPASCSSSTSSRSAWPCPSRSSRRSRSTSGTVPAYPFSLAEKAAKITEPSPWYTPEGASSNPWGQVVVPFEMASVLANKSGRGFPVRGPVLGLFLDLEVRMVAGPDRSPTTTTS